MARFILALALAAAAQAGAHRDWAAAPAIVEIDTREDVYAIGDAHADYDRLVKLLVAAKILGKTPATPSEPRWTAGRSVVVFTGDMIDKGPHALKVLELIHRLEIAAPSSGGRVVVLMGNHEAEFLAGTSPAKSKEFRAELASVGWNASKVAACEGDLGRWLCSLAFGARVNGWFFSHAGNTAGRTLPKLSADLEAGVEKDGFRTPELIGDNSLLEARLGKNPWIEKGPGRDAQALLAADAAALGVQHIVEGHQPAKLDFADGVVREAGEMFQRYGLLFLIDTGMSVGVGDSHGAALHIRGDEAVAICPSGQETVIWDRGEHARIGRAAPCK